MTIESPKLAFVPEDFYFVKILVVPMWGLYANMIAQLISQISSHFIVHYHRQIILKAKEEYNDIHGVRAESKLVPTNKNHQRNEILMPQPKSETKEQLCSYPFSRIHRDASEKLVVRRFINIVLPMGSFMMCVLLAVSCDIPSLKLETLGILGLFIELGQNLEPAIRYEGVFTMAQLLIDQAKYLGGFRNYIGLGTVVILFVATVLLVPIAQIMTLVFHWFAPLTPKRREKVALVLEILQAWQYVEVYILAIIIESWCVIKSVLLTFIVRIQRLTCSRYLFIFEQLC